MKPFLTCLKTVPITQISLMIHPDKCHHPRAKEAFGAIAKAQTTLLDPDERGYILQQINQAKGEGDPFRIPVRIRKVSEHDEWRAY